ncbi:MAG: HlyD family secretion protein [Burkholderiales bacterium]|nr:HlyD family secretion protein [Burkholderiales bacterium]
MRDPAPEGIPEATPPAEPAPPGRGGARPPAGRSPRRFVRRVLLLLGPLVVAAVAAYVYYTGGRYVSTDNAFIKADKVAVSAEVAGQVKEVLVVENAPVVEGQMLFRIDDAPYRVAVARARADLLKVRTDIASLKASYRQKAAQLDIAQTNLAFAEREYVRQTELAQKHFISQAKLDEAKQARELAGQQRAAAEQDLAQVAASLGGRPDIPLEQHPTYLAANAALAQAELDLARTVVRAPFAGIASQVPKPGQYLDPGTAAMAVVADGRVWVEANFVETDLTHVAPGEPATIRIDTYPGRVWHGKVESISPATGAEFAILPPQNATGNWVKVVQRIPVRIALAEDPGAPQLRAGMSVEAEIDTGRHRGLPWVAQAATPARASQLAPGRP